MTPPSSTRLLPLLLLLVGCGSAIGSRLPALPLDPAAEGYRLLSRPAPLPKGAVTFDCGPEALCAILVFFNKPADIAGITARIYDPVSRGTFATAIPSLARELGLANHPVTGRVSRLKAAVDRDHPCLIMVRLRKDLHHFFVVAGYNDRSSVVVCEEYDGSKRLLGYEELEELWRPVGFWCLEFYPAGAAEDVDAAQAFEERGDHARAAELYRRAIEKDPADADAVTGLANCLKMKGDLAGSRERYEEALRLRPDHPVALINFADQLVASGQELPRAAELAGRAVDVCTAERRLLKEDLARASKYQKERIAADLAGAEDFLAAAFGTLGQAEAAAGHPVPAISAFKASLDLVPLDEADRRARRMIEIGDQYRKLSMGREAQLQFTRALETAKDPALRKTAEERLR